MNPTRSRESQQRHEAEMEMDDEDDDMEELPMLSAKDVDLNAESQSSSERIEGNSRLDLVNRSSSYLHDSNIKLQMLRDMISTLEARFPGNAFQNEPETERMEDDEERKEVDVDDDANQDRFRWNEEEYPEWDHAKEYTVNGSRLSRFWKSFNFSDDVYVTAWCAQNGTEQSTEAVYGVKQFAQWTSNEKNKLHFFIPRPGEKDKHIPIEFLIQLVDWDSHSVPDLMGLYIVDVRPAVYSKKKAFALELFNGRSFAGTLFVNVNIMDSSQFSEEELVEMEIIRNKRQEKRREAIRKTELEIKRKNLRYRAEKMRKVLQDLLKMIEEHEAKAPYMLIEMEILRFDKAAECKSNLKKHQHQLMYFLFLSIWILAFAGIMSTLEDWDYLTAVYYSIVTLTTVGYGDVYPESDGGRAVASIWIILSTSVAVVVLLNWMSETVDYFHYLKVHTAANESWLQALDGLLNTQLENEEEKSGKDEATNHLLHLLEHHGLNVSFPEMKGFNAIIFWASLLIGWMTVWILFFCVVAEETMSFKDAMWFAVVSATTTGYGDIHADGQKDRQMFIIFVLIWGVATMMNLAGTILNEVQKRSAKNVTVNAISLKDERAAMDPICNLKKMSEHLGQVQENFFGHLEMSVSSVRA